MSGILRRVLGTVGLSSPREAGGARGPDGAASSPSGHGRLNSAAANCTGFDGRPLASILTPGEAEAGLRPGDHLFVKT